MASKSSEKPGSRLKTLQVIIKQNTKDSLREVGVRIQTDSTKKLKSAG